MSNGSSVAAAVEFVPAPDCGTSLNVAWTAASVPPLSLGLCCIVREPFTAERTKALPSDSCASVTSWELDSGGTGVIQSVAAAVAAPVLASQSPVVRPARRNGPNRTACIDAYSGRSSEGFSYTTQSYFFVVIINFNSVLSIVRIPMVKSEKN